MSKRRSTDLLAVDPFGGIFENAGYLAALLRVFNEPEFRHKDAWPFLNGLQDSGYIENTRTNYSVGQTPWWSMRPKGRAITRAFALAHGDKKEAFLRATYGMFR